MIKGSGKTSNTYKGTIKLKDLPFIFGTTEVLLSQTENTERITAS